MDSLFINRPRNFLKNENSKLLELSKILKINKGNLSIGSDADLCIVDIYKPWVVKKEKMISKSKNTCIEDKKLQGKVLNTFINGVELFKC